MPSHEKPESITIGWIGTGVMGGPMAAHLQEAGYPLRVYNRSRSKTEKLIAQGATGCDSPAEAAQGSDFVFSIVGFPKDVREVYFGHSGILSGTQPGAILVDMTTSEPTLAVEIAQAAEDKQAMALDAPVSGGDVGAREAKLCIMVGGPEKAFEAALPLFRLMGKTIQRFGGPGAGQHTKMVNQIFITGVMIGLCEGLVYGHRAGLPLEELIQTLSTGAANSWSLQNLAPRCLAGNFEPGFFVEHFIKDMGIALAEAKQMNLSLPGLALVHQMYLALQAQGGGRKGTQALLLAIERLSGLEHFAKLDKQ